MKNNHVEIPEIAKSYILQNRLSLSLIDDFPRTCSVYFLIKGNDIVYVGQSVWTLERVRTHKNKGVDFDGVFFIECNGDELRAIEQYYIKKFLPMLNMQYTGKRQRPFKIHLNAKRIASLFNDLANSVKD